MHNLARVAAEGTKEGTVSIHDNEPKLLIRFEQLSQGFGVELVVAEIQGGVDGFEGLKVNVDLALLAFRGQNFATVDNKSIGRDLVVELQSLLGRCDGRKDGLSVDTRLDVGGRAILFSKHLCDS